MPHFCHAGGPLLLCWQEGRMRWPADLSGAAGARRCPGSVSGSQREATIGGQTVLLRGLISLFLLLGVVGPGHAQSLQDLEKAQAALIAAWEKTPLSVRRAIFVAKKAQGFGQFEERSSNVFKPGEPLIAYAEPVGYGWKDVGNGVFEFGFAVDFLIKSPDGKILAGQQDFAKLAERSHARNLEFMVTLTLNVTGAPPGDYVVEYKMRDIAGDKSTSFELPFKIAK